MEVTDAIKIAKDYIALIYKDEGAFNIGLEEVELDEKQWRVTVGFSRRWDRPPRSPFGIAIEGEDHRATARTYKVVEIDNETGEVLGVSNRQGLL
ncbi:MAG TPA: hypothetical protein VM574_00140 [Terrimicrobiaceae bacterium]|jgi:hypothetical protein|nr:hypothetical protein [Terrimicrobiaceae bacterium]